MRGGLCFSGWVRRQITRHRKEMTAAWRRGCSPERASLSEGPCSPGRDTGHLMRAWAWRAGGVAPPPPPGPARAHGSCDAVRDQSPRLVPTTAERPDPAGQPRRPVRCSGPRPAPRPRARWACPDLGSPRPHCGQGHTCVQAWTAAGSPPPSQQLDAVPGHSIPAGAWKAETP